MRDVDTIIERLRAERPDVRVEQLVVKHPGDDDGLWFFTPPNSRFDVQIESSDGMCPFLIEGWHGERATAQTVDEAVSTLKSWLHTGIQPEV